MRSLLAVIVALASFPLDARPCSLAPGPEPGAFPQDSTTVNTRPLFFALADRGPKLTRVEPPTEIELELVDELTGTFRGHRLMRVWRPIEPLTAGQYRLTGVSNERNHVDEVDLFVDPSLPLEASELTGVTLRVTLDEPGESGCDSTSCDDIDFTKLELLVPEDADIDLMRVEVRNPKTGLRRIELVEIPSFAINGRRSVLFWNDQRRWQGSFKRDRMCVEATPLAEFGALGPTIDLGCFEPDDDDPRVIDTRGCGSGGTHGGTMLLWLVFLVLGRHIATRRPTKAN